MENKIAALYEAQLAKYTKAGASNPQLAAQFAVADILNMYKTQMQYIDELLDQEIEDTLKAMIAL